MCSSDKQNMNEAIAFGTLKVLLGPVINALVNAAWERNRNPGHVTDNVFFKVNEFNIKQLVEEAKGVLDEGKGPNLERFNDLAKILTEVELYGDIIKFISHRKFEENRNWDSFKNEVDELVNKLKSELDKHPKSQSSGRENEGESSGRENEGDPPCKVRRALLYLFQFQNYVFNRQRISRLLVAHEFIAADKPRLQQLTNWLEPAETRWDGDGAPNHFLIGNDVQKSIPTWPENGTLVRQALAESEAEYEIFHSSIIFLGERNSLDLKEKKFFFLKVLSLRNGTLKNEEYLKKLSLLKYLDLKNTTVQDCRWLEGLEELQMLDLRHTKVEKIHDECLEKLGKLQNLLLGYCPNSKDGVNRLAGVKLNTIKLKSEKLETLRAIRLDDVDVIGGSVDKVVDLSVTGLDTERLKKFWDAVGNFEKLTSLGVSVTGNTVITLKDCPDTLKNKLKRLRMEGKKFSVLDKLDKFNHLIDLTLASDKPIIDRIPILRPLLCLRLYGYLEETICKIDLKGFNSLKKVVIGDMKKVTKIEISSAVIETVTTLKLCNLKKFEELVCLESKTKGTPESNIHNSQTPKLPTPIRPPLLRRNLESKTEGFKDIQSDKTIFLKGVDCKKFQASPRLKIYGYDMNKQCYKELRKVQTT